VAGVHAFHLLDGLLVVLDDGPVDDGGVVGSFADVLGVDPQVMATRASQDRQDEEWEKLFGLFGVSKFLISLGPLPAYLLAGFSPAARLPVRPIRGMGWEGSWAASRTCSGLTLR
jgi:hypothetical protein